MILIRLLLSNVIFQFYLHCHIWHYKKRQYLSRYCKLLCEPDISRISKEMQLSVSNTRHKKSKHTMCVVIHKRKKIHYKVEWSKKYHIHVVTERFAFFFFFSVKLWYRQIFLFFVLNNLFLLASFTLIVCGWIFFVFLRMHFFLCTL